MFPFTHPSFAANGNVSPCRFIAPVVTSVGGSLAVQASDATVLIMGVSWERTRIPPGEAGDDGFCAIANEPLSYYGPGEICNLTLGATVTEANNQLTTDSAGKGIKVDFTSDSAQCIGAINLTPGVSGDKVMVYVCFPTWHRPVHA